ncbi:MAG TPA: MBL fold metallo-hydrolase [candidate division Zixibacteria bacterium]|nr:MBL fold metallo-hydrolase [candidate division Zixibacteria bacterium]
MRMRILGCGDAFGNGGRNQSAYLVEAAAGRLLLDCGPAALLAMKRAGFDPCSLDLVVLSHLHGDHMGGLPFLFISYLYEKGPSGPLTIAGPPGTQARVVELFRVMYGGGSAPELPALRFCELEPGRPTTFGGFEVLPFRVPHQVHEISLALKIRGDDKTILFSGDSAWTELFVEHARGADLFLCECSFYERETANHMSYLRLSAEIARLGCKRVLLTHLGADVLARRAEIALPLAEDGMVVEI